MDKVVPTKALGPVRIVTVVCEEKDHYHIAYMPHGEPVVQGLISSTHWPNEEDAMAGGLALLDQHVAWLSSHPNEDEVSVLESVKDILDGVDPTEDSP